MMNYSLREGPPLVFKIIVGFAAAYNLSYAAFLIFGPSHWVMLLPLGEFFGPVFWQVLALGIAAFGLLYLAIAKYFSKLWPLIALGAFSKLFGATIAFGFIAKGWLPTAYLWAILVNDLAWLPLFGWILYRSFKVAQHTTTGTPEPLDKLLKEMTDQHNITLAQHTDAQAVLLVFLRHFGCTFCKEALADLAETLPEITSRGSKLVLVHMADSAYADRYFAGYGLAGISHISDPQCKLYEAMHLERARFSQVFGLKAWLRGAQAMLTKGHGIGKLVGDGFRMPGVFLIYRGEILKAFRHRSAADLPDYESLATCPFPQRPITTE